MSLRNLTPLAQGAIDLGQAGMFMILVDAAPGTVYTGHAHGTSGNVSQDYVELLAGKECDRFTSEDNTTGTYFFPEIDSFHSMFNISRDHLNATVDAPVQAKTSIHDNLSRSGNYDPGTVSPSDYIFLTFDDTIFGRFNRIAVSKPHISFLDKMRLIINKGGSNGT